MDLTEHSRTFGGVGQQVRILVAGVGGGGCNTAARMAVEWKEGPDLAAINTDAQALAACAVPCRVQIGKHLTEGLSAGGDAAVGKLAAEEDGNVLRELVAAYDMVFIVTALGGGTGSGAAAVLARIAREEGALTIGFAALPFEFEGERRRLQADEGLQALRRTADVVIAMPNQMLPELVDKDTSLTDAFGKIDGMIGASIRAIWKLLSQAGIINLDFADLRQLVENSGGTCRFGYGEGSGSGKTAEAIADVLRNPLLDQGKVLASAPALLVSLLGGPDLTLADVQKVMSQLTALARQDAKLIMGAAVDEAWQGRLAVTVLAAEAWHAGDTTASPISPVATPRADAPPKVHAGSAKGSAPRPVQATLQFDATDKGRFKNIEPTIHDGEDLDLPTYIRRGIKLSFEK